MVADIKENELVRTASICVPCRVLRNQETTEQSCYADRSASRGKSPHVNFAPSDLKWKSTIPDHMENLHVSLNSLAASCPGITCTPQGLINVWNQQFRCPFPLASPL